MSGVLFSGLTRRLDGTVSSIRELQQLQELDTALASCRLRLDEVQNQLNDTLGLLELKERAGEEYRRLAEVEQLQRSREWEVETTREHVKEMEAKLYGGTVKSPKELVGFQDEVNMLKTRQRQQEDEVLAVMTQLEEHQTRCTDLARDLAQAETERKALEERLTEEQRQLNAEVEQLTSRHGVVAAQVPRQDLGLYTTLLTTKQGRALAQAEGSMCRGCRINLPMNILQRLRTNQALVQCPSCGRLLFMG